MVSRGVTADVKQKDIVTETGRGAIVAVDNLSLR